MDEWGSGGAHFAVSDSGMLVYAAGGIWESPPVEMVLMDERGGTEPMPGCDRPMASPQGRFSPDGRQYAFIEKARSGLVWVFDLQRQTYRCPV